MVILRRNVFRAGPRGVKPGFRLVALCQTTTALLDGENVRTTWTDVATQQRAFGKINGILSVCQRKKTTMMTTRRRLRFRRQRPIRRGGRRTHPRECPQPPRRELPRPLLLTHPRLIQVDAAHRILDHAMLTGVEIQRRNVFHVVRRAARFGFRTVPSTTTRNAWRDGRSALTTSKDVALQLCA